MLEDFGSLGIDNRPRMTFSLFLLASPPNATLGKRNVMQNYWLCRNPTFHFSRLYRAVAKKANDLVAAYFSLKV